MLRDDWMTTKEAAEALYIAPDTLRTYAKRAVGCATRIHYEHIGDIIVWSHESVEIEIARRARAKTLKSAIGGDAVIAAEH